jgi:hypothetical protein
MVLGRSTSGCSSPVELCLAGTVDGKGFLDGATWRFTADAETPSGSAVAYTGRTVIAVRTGTITTDTKVSLESEAISIRDRVTAVNVMEPRLMGARESFTKGTGELAMTGPGNLDHGFPVEVTGEICLLK